MELAPIERSGELLAWFIAGWILLSLVLFGANMTREIQKHVYKIVQRIGYRSWRDQGFFVSKSVAEHVAVNLPLGHDSTPAKVEVVTVDLSSTIDEYKAGLETRREEERLELRARVREKLKALQLTPEELAVLEGEDLEEAGLLPPDEE